MIKLYNTLTRKKEIFKPLKKDEVTMYTCGPTVYWFQHIGNLRTYIFSDILKRTLLFNGLKVKQIINITDVGHLTSDSDEGEDKMEKAASKEGRSAKDIADFYFNKYHEELKKLNFIDPYRWTKATEHIKEQIELIKRLEGKGYTYKTSDGIYFDTSKFKDYGKLAGLKIEGIEAGKRISLKEKRNPTDFAMWKFSEFPGKRQQEWESPWGLGFPGWHIECSAMAIRYLGEQIDLHTGAEDHIQIHHTNEIAQSEAATGKKFVNIWMHARWLLFKGEKVSKSKGGLYTLTELEELGYNPLHFRYMCLLTNYRKQLDFSLDKLDSARTAFERLKKKVLEIKMTVHPGKENGEKFEKEYLAAINDDLNTPKAIQIVWAIVDDLSLSSKLRLNLLKSYDKVLGLGIDKMKEESIEVPMEVKKLIDEREKLRKEKKWAESDILRERIKERGFSVSDSESGPKVEKI